MLKSLRYLAVIVATAVALVASGKLDLGDWWRRLAGPGNGTANKPTVVAWASDNEKIRIAAFNIQMFGQKKLADAAVMKYLVDVAGRFDVLAVQEVRSVKQDVMPRFVEALNARAVSHGKHYDFVISDRLGDTTSKEQYAFVFDTTKIEVDHRQVYVVRDPGNRLHREPHVASFRVRGVPTDEAFTFTLVNVHTDPDLVMEELAALDEAYHRVRDNSGGEDDIIMLGDFNTHGRRLGELGHVPYLTPAIVGQPTNTQGTKQYDNILYHREATREYTGVSGVLDLRREYGLTYDEAKLISDHFPVWAEFSIYEGGPTRHLAGRPAGAGESQRR